MNSRELIVPNVNCISTIKVGQCWPQALFGFTANISVFWMTVRLGSTEELGWLSKRGKYEIWRGFGSDGYLYDFVNKNRQARRYKSSKPNYGFHRLPLTRYSNLLAYNSPTLQSLRSHKYDIRPGFGSDGYLYDFVK